MFEDPVVEEMERIKEEFAKESGYDVDKMFEVLRAEQQLHPELVVSFEVPRVAEDPAKY